MQKAFFVATSLLVLVNCTDDSSTLENSCRYDGQRKVTFSSSWLITKDEAFDKNNTLLYYYTFNYNANNDITSVNVRNPNGTIIGYIVSSLNSSGNSVLDIYLNSDSTMLAYEIFAYDSSDRMVSSSSYAADSSLENVHLYYYDVGNLTNRIESYDADNNLIETIKNERDGDGLVIRAVNTNANGKETGYREYSYSLQTYTMTISNYDCTAEMAKRAYGPLWRQMRMKCMWQESLK